MNNNVLIIGAGLAGILLAYRLKKKGIPVLVIEARDRVGGRIHTYLTNQDTPIEMGATWLGDQHTTLIKLLKELGVSRYPQYTKGTAWYEPMPMQAPQKVMLPHNENPSYRIQGGSHALINKLVQGIEKENIHLNTVATHIKAHDYHIEVITKDTTFTASRVVSTVPPNLLANTVQFNPPLPDHLITIAKKTHTWMGESIKFGVSYANPFWKKDNGSGTLYSNVGPITEMYDHSTLDKDKYALKGFLKSELITFTKKERKEKVLTQLQRTFGEQALEYLSYEETVWQEQPQTFTSYKSYVMPHQNNGHSVYQETLYNHRLYIAGSETASHYGGYMEGAVRSAQKCFEDIIKK